MTATGVAGTMRTDNLALMFQEILTVIVRLRSNRQDLSDAESFRFSVKEALKTVIQEARQAGYASDDIRMTTLALAGFLDESIMNMRNPLFAEWPRKPLQERVLQMLLPSLIHDDFYRFTRNMPASAILPRSPS